MYRRAATTCLFALESTWEATLPKAMMTAFMCLGLFNPAAAASLPCGASTLLLETYDDWAVACRAQSSVVGCVLRQVQTNSQTASRCWQRNSATCRRAYGWGIAPALRPALAQGVTLKVDDAAALPVLAFSTCLPAVVWRLSSLMLQRWPSSSPAMR